MHAPTNIPHSWAVEYIDYKANILLIKTLVYTHSSSKMAINLNSVKNIFLTFQTYAVTGKTHVKVQRIRGKVTFYLLQVQYPWYHCFLCLAAAVEKITIRWIALSGP